MKSVMVIYARPEGQWRWQVTLPDPATVADALESARAQAGDTDVPWDADVGIFGALCDRNAVPRDGDRIELYRPLRADPKESRRARVEAGRRARDLAASQPRPRSSSDPSKRGR